VTAGRAVRVAMCGTFDVKNYGDLLFPLALRHELGKRIPGIEVECFSYHAKTPPDWPYPVSSVSQLPEVIRSFDAVIIGGGHLIRFDKDVAPGYLPPSPEMHHPTSYWLFPALLALEANVPVLWSAVGASPDLPPWGSGLLKEVLRASAYVSVRDAPSQIVLQALGSECEVAIVPDTAFGVRDLISLGGDPEHTGKPYVAIQPTHNLNEHWDALRRFVEWLRRQKYDVALVPISPALGDDAKIMMDVAGREAAVYSWGDPAKTAMTIANASAIAGVSLHMTITAVAFGVPVLRPFQKVLSKHRSAHDLPGVFSLEGYAKNPDPVHQAILTGGRRSAEMDVFYERLTGHWDRIAQIITRPASSPHSGLASLFQRLPFLLENGGAALKRGKGA